MKERTLAALATIVLGTGCNGDPPETKPEPEPEPAWQVVLDEQDLDRAALSVWGASADEVFVVGGPLGNTPYQALGLFYDGSSWTDLAPGGDDSLWWVHGTSSSDVWMVGENGRITHHDGTSFSEHSSGVTATIWGVYAFGADDVWAVGGTPLEGTMAPNDIVLHYSGGDWEPVTLPDAPLGVAHYKVWGTSSVNLYVVGEGGTIWHLQSGSWTNESGATTATLFTVWGCGADEVYAVGNNAVLRSTGDGNWESVTVSLNSGVNGVTCAGSGEVALAGFGGLKQRLVAGEWVDEFTARPFDDLHATWAAAGDEIWVAGGDFISKSTPNAPRKGIVARFGVGDVADAVQ